LDHNVVIPLGGARLSKAYQKLWGFSVRMKGAGNEQATYGQLVAGDSIMGAVAALYFGIHG
jgi:hypothetical protein